MDYSHVVSKDRIEKAATALRANAGIEVFVEENGEAAMQRALALIPQGAEVFTMTSVTTETIGLRKELDESGRYNSVRAALAKMDPEKDAREKRMLGAAPDWTVGSVHAVTEEGEVLIASNTGSQLAAYVSGANRVVWVVGGQKVVANREDGMKRIYEYVLPIEGERANKAYGITSGSHVSKLLILNKEFQPGRITLILVNEALGF